MPKKCWLIRHYETRYVPATCPAYLDGIVWSGPTDPRVEDRLLQWAQDGLRVWRYLMVWTYPLPEWNDPFCDIIRDHFGVLTTDDGRIPTTPFAWPNYGRRPFLGWPSKTDATLRDFTDDIRLHHFKWMIPFTDMHWSDLLYWMFEPTVATLEDLSTAQREGWRRKIRTFYQMLVESPTLMFSPAIANASLYGAPQMSFRDGDMAHAPANYYEASIPDYPPVEFTSGSMLSVQADNGLAVDWGIRRWCQTGGNLVIRQLPNADDPATTELYMKADRMRPGR